MPTSASLGAVGEFAASRHGALTRREAAENGMGRMAITRLCRRGVFDEPAPGVLRIRGAPHTFEQHSYVATLAGGGHGMIIGGTAPAYVGWSAANSSPLVVRRVIEQIVARRASDLGIDLAPLCRR